MPGLAAGLVDGSVLFFDERGLLRSRFRPSDTGGAVPDPIADLRWDGERLLGLSRGGEVFAVSAEGKLLWRADTRCPSGRLELFAARVVVASKGRAVSLSMKGDIYREADLVNAAGIGAISPAGLLFSLGMDWILAAYRFERPLGPPLASALRAYPKMSGVAEEALAFDPEAGDSERQLFLLADIEKKLRSGTIGTQEPRAAAYCAAVALGELEGGSTGPEGLPGGDPLPRARACVLLGWLGSPDYRGALCRVLATEGDPAVAAAACDALAAIGVDPGGLSAAAFVAAAGRPVDEE